MSKMKLPMNLSENEVGFGGSVPMVDERPGPTVHFEWGEKYDFPDNGVMTVKFRVKRREEYLPKNPNEKKRYEVALELIELQKVKAENNSPANSYDEAGKAMDKLRAEMEG